jgi:hypothetical protein
MIVRIYKFGLEIIKFFCNIQLKDNMFYESSVSVIKPDKNGTVVKSMQKLKF